MKWGRRDEVIPSPLIPVSSAGAIFSVGAVVGPLVLTVKVRTGPLVVPKELVATTWNEWGPLASGLGGWRVKLPLASLVVAASTEPVGAPLADRNSATGVFASVTPVRRGWVTLVNSGWPTAAPESSDDKI